MKREELIFDEIKRGYGIFCATGSDFYITNALHIEKIDEVNKFSDDEEATEQAKKDGILFINDIDGIEKNIYIDTEENRKVIIEFLKSETNTNKNK